MSKPASLLFAVYVLRSVRLLQEPKTDGQPGNLHSGIGGSHSRSAPECRKCHRLQARRLGGGITWRVRTHGQGVSAQ